ncbi:MAG: DUF1499 domain-containing protein [Pseudomonadota bacterium]
MARNTWRWLGRALGAGVLLAVIGGVMVWSVSHNPDVWHVDPMSADRTGRPNDALVATADTTRAEPDRVLAPIAETPDALMARLDAAMMEKPRVARVARSGDGLHVTYVERSALIAFPDYVSVRALAGENGTNLAIWSRSRFGYSDMGINAARVDQLLDRLGLVSQP